MYRRPVTSNGAVRCAVRRLGRLVRSVLPGLDTPLTVAVLVVFAMTGLVLRWGGRADGEVMHWASTNLINLHSHPAPAMLASIFISPVALPSDLLVFAVAGAIVERRAGPVRVAVVALLGHVIATLVTEGWVSAAIWSHVEPRSAAWQLDIGISYVAFTVAAAALRYVPWTWRAAAVAGVAGWVLLPLAEHPDVASSGHVLSVLIGVLSWHWLPVPTEASATTPHPGPGGVVRRYRGALRRSVSTACLIGLAGGGLLTVGLGTLPAPDSATSPHPSQHAQHNLARHAHGETSAGWNPRRPRVDPDIAGNQRHRP